MRKIFDTGNELVSLSNTSDPSTDIDVRDAEFSYKKIPWNTGGGYDVHLTILGSYTQKVLVLSGDSSGECPKLKEFLEVVNDLLAKATDK